MLVTLCYVEIGLRLVVRVGLPYFVCLAKVGALAFQKLGRKLYNLAQVTRVCLFTS